MKISLPQLFILFQTTIKAENKTFQPRRQIMNGSPVGCGSDPSPVKWGLYSRVVAQYGRPVG